MVLIPYQQYEALKTHVVKPSNKARKRKRPTAYRDSVELTARCLKRKPYADGQSYQSLASFLRHDERLRQGLNDKLDVLLAHLERNPGTYVSCKKLCHRFDGGIRQALEGHEEYVPVANRVRFLPDRQCSEFVLQDGVALCMRPHLSGWDLVRQGLQ